MKKLILCYIFVLNILLCFNFSSFASTETVYIITTQKELESISENPSAHYVLGRNLKLENYTSVKEFDGIFDGNGKYIIFENAKNGVFESTTENAVIKNLNTGGSIESAGNSYIAAIAGINKGNITDCNNYASVNGRIYVGGIAGHIPPNSVNAVISHCINFGEIRAGYWLVGGIAGYSQGGKIKNCGNAGTVSAYSSDAGGILGRAGGSVEISECYNTGKIVSKLDVGGIAGASEGGNKDIYNCFNLGCITAVNNTQTAGGIIGSAYYKCETDYDIHNYSYCYNGGQILSEGVDVSETNSIFGSYDKNGIPPELENCFNNENITSLYETYTDWDFYNIWKLETDKCSFPILKSIGFYKENPGMIMEIHTAEDLKRIEDFPGYSYILMKNLKISEFEPINEFCGYFDGNGKYIESDAFIFKSISNDAVIKNLNVGGINELSDKGKGIEENVSYGKCALVLSDVDDFKEISKFPYADYELISDINLSGVSGLDTFSGSIDGKGHYIYSDGVLFEELSSNAVIKNINFGGNTDICSVNKGKILNCTFGEFVFEIKTSEDLMKIKRFPSSSYILLNDIELNNYMPETVFSGEFNGNGKTIIFENSANGLFAEISEKGNVYNLVISGEISSPLNNVGGICSINRGKISDITINAEIKGAGSVGGVSGCLSDNGIIKGCSNFGNITAYNSSSGGIAGRIQSGSIINCDNKGRIESTDSSGGIAGRICSDSFVLQSFNSGDVSVKKGNAGGIIGEGIYCNNVFLKDNINIGAVIKDNTDYIQYGGIMKETVGVSVTDCFYLSDSQNISTFGTALSYEEIMSYLPEDTEIFKVDIVPSPYGKIYSDREYAVKNKEVSLTFPDNCIEYILNGKTVLVSDGKTVIFADENLRVEGVFLNEKKLPSSPKVYDIYENVLNIFSFSSVGIKEKVSLIGKKTVTVFGEIYDSNGFYTLKDYGFVLYDENESEIKRISAYNNSDNLKIGGVFYGDFIENKEYVYVSLYAVYTDEVSAEYVLLSEDKRKIIPEIAVFDDPVTKIPEFISSEDVVGITAYSLECVRATSGMTKLGHRTYISFIGSPSYIYEFDTLSGEFVNRFPMGSGQLYSFQVGSDGMLYISPNGNDSLYKYNPESRLTEKISDYVSGNGMLSWHMTTGDNGKADKLYTAHYLSNYDTLGGNPVGEYDVDNESVKVYEKVSENVKYMHSATGNDKYIFAGYGSTSGTETVVRIDKETGERKYWKNEEGLGSGTMIQTTLINNLLFVRLGGWSIAIDIDTMTEFARFQSGTRGGRQSVSWIMPGSDDSKVYYLGVNEQTLMEFDLNTGKTSLNVRFKNYTSGLGVIHFGNWIKKSNGEYSIVAVLDYDKIGLITPGSNVIEYVDIKMPLNLYGNATRPNYYYVSDDDVLYTGGYEAGLNGFDLKNNKMLFSVNNDIQHGMVMINNILLGGTYPDGKFYMYDPSKDSINGINPRHVWTAPKNIIRFYNSKETNAGFGLWAGVTDYGGKQGAVILGTVIDGVPHFKAYENVIPGENIVSVEYRDGYIYAGSSVTVNLNEFHNEAHLAKIDARTGETVLIKSYSFDGLLPSKRIGELAFGPDGLLYAAMSEGNTIAAIDPETLEVVKYKTYYPDSEEDYGVYPQKMLFGTEGVLYSIMNGQLHAIDIRTMESVVIFNNIDRMTIDNYGNILKKYGTDSNSNYMSLIKVNQRSRLEIMIENADKYYRKNEFSKDSFEVFERALTNAKKTDFDSSSEEEVKKTARELSDAIKNLKTVYDEKEGFAYPFTN